MQTAERTALPDSLLAEIEVEITRMIREAGEKALSFFQTPLQVEFKQDNRSDPVTEADKTIEAFLKSSILSRFPDHGVLGEEGTDVDVEGRDLVWVLDPIDGTTNFMNGLPLFGCSAGLLHRGTPMVGAIFVPVVPAVRTPDSGEESGVIPRSGVLHARLGGGAWLDDMPVRATCKPKPEPTMLVGLPGFHSSQFRRTRGMLFNPGEPRSMGSVTYETALVACGIFGYSIFRRPKIWDVAAGALLVREAGGVALLWTNDGWRPMERFERMRPAKGDSGPSLRHWSGTLLLGGTETVQYAAGRMRPGRGFVYRVADKITGLFEWWRYRRARKGGEKKRG